jgi:hypothetical protein
MKQVVNASVSVLSNISVERLAFLPFVCHVTGLPDRFSGVLPFNQVLKWYLKWGNDCFFSASFLIYHLPSYCL